MSQEIPRADHVMEIDTSSSSERKKRKDIRALYAAALKGNWQDAKALVKKDPTLLHSKLTPREDTVLHIATSANRSSFVKKLVDLGKVDKAFSIDLTLRNKNGDTAFSIAIAFGFVDIARIMKKEKDELSNLTSRAIHEETPKENDEQPNQIKETSLLKAVHGGHKKMATYLFSLIDIKQLDDADRNRLFVATVTNEMYDISLEMLCKCRTLAKARDPKSNLTALHVLAQKSQRTTSGSEVGTTITYIYSSLMPTSAYQLLKKIWEHVLKLDDEEILQLIRETPRVLFEAVKSGNVEFVTLLVKSLPYLMHEVDEEGKRIFDVAISHSNEKIFNLCVSIGAFGDTSYTTHIDDDGNNMLHLAGKSSPQEMLDILPPNLQMQQEHSLFKEVEKIMSPGFINMKNKKGETPKDVFLKEHKDLIVKARTAMKETASSCMVVSTLISGIVFSAAFALCTVPGSPNSNEPASSNREQETYNSNHLFSIISPAAEPVSWDSSHETAVYIIAFNWFTICVIANTVALFSSTTSTIMLLSILTSLFVESEHIKSLRANMRWAIKALFISIISLIIAFTAAVCFLFNNHSSEGKLKVFTASFAAVVPAILFIFLYLRLGMGRI